MKPITAVGKPVIGIGLSYEQMTRIYYACLLKKYISYNTFLHGFLRTKYHHCFSGHLKYL
jgi:hypothetical protein